MKNLLSKKVANLLLEIFGYFWLANVVFLFLSVIVAGYSYWFLGSAYFLMHGREQGLFFFLCWVSFLSLVLAVAVIASEEKD